MCVWVCMGSRGATHEARGGAEDLHEEDARHRKHSKAAVLQLGLQDGDTDVQSEDSGRVRQ